MKLLDGYKNELCNFKFYKTILLVSITKFFGLPFNESIMIFFSR